MSRSLGIPVKLLHEASGHIVTVELKSGELYRGSMIECEDNWNCQLEDITFTAKVNKDHGDVYLGAVPVPETFRGLVLHGDGYFAGTALDGKVSQLEHVFIRGSKVRFMVIPDILKHAPMFKRLDARIKGKSGSLGVGRGRAAMRGKALATGRGTGGRGAVPPVRR
ncbi:hypothetical protein DY000_02055199 [Brassica cretica]|uniref:Small nuclear ribonucleoprotein Sm D3 n=1 Tax=Brassica cretica TaxID=69181 RepID=A0ABQ7AM36_BRACR|nr:hypothetical protein DY000_02055199 [Brassica cretica]